MGNQTVAIQGRKFSTFKTMGLKTAALVVAAGDWAHCTIQNNATTPLKVYNALAADQADTNLIQVLAAATADLDGSGGSVCIQNCTGPISVAGTTISYVVAAA